MNEKKSFRIKDIRFVITLDLFKCHKHIKQQRLLLTCAPISRLPSNISTKIHAGSVGVITYCKSEQCTDTDKQIRRQIIMGQLNAFAHLFDIEICAFKWLNRISCLRENANIEKSTCFQCKQMP